jgi:mannosyltransferase OCH1-like enzyme
MIPKKIHMIWIGDELKRPEKYINSWFVLNHDFEIKVWGNKDLQSLNWHNKKLMNELWNVGYFNGVADLMRYELLHEFGGVYVDADSLCLKKLEHWLLETDNFVAWENEHVRPGLLGNGVIGAKSKSSFMLNVILEAGKILNITESLPWLTVGPTLITNVWSKNKFPLTVYPSHYFYPNHHTGFRYTGNGHVFCEQLWQSTPK